jgi:SAM-dependent methyltransferase
MYENYRESHKEPGRGSSYDRAFRENAHRAIIWELEKRAIDDAVRRFFADRPIRHLDFACGTARILCYLEDRAIQSTGVDVSPSMLEVARANARKAEILHADLTRQDVLGQRQFDLITAFRFFPNAEPALRRDAMAAIVKHLAPSGYVVFNNHMNQSSLLNRFGRLLCRGGTMGMAQAEVDELVATAGLKIEKVYPIGLLPATERHLFMPRQVLRAIERMASACGVFKGLSQDLIFVCGRAAPLAQARGPRTE